MYAKITRELDAKLAGTGGEAGGEVRDTLTCELQQAGDAQ